MTKNFMVRQGDVLVVAVTSTPKGVTPVDRENGRAVLAHGELTGHAHAIADKGATLFCDPKFNAMFLAVGGNAPVALNHDEHDTINIPPGNYHVIRQREYSPEAIRNVED